MSKINIELDLNLGGYDYDDNYISLEESIKDEIVKSLSKKIEGNVLNDIKEKALRQVEIRIDEVVNNLLKDMFWLTRLDMPYYTLDHLVFLPIPKT